MSLPALRPYQLQAVQSIWRELMYRKSTLRVAAPGTGKTAEIGALTRLWLLKRKDRPRVIITAPRSELLDQAEGWIQAWCPFLHSSQIGREQAGEISHEGHRVILASLQSLHDERLRHLPTCGLEIRDETHLHYAQRSTPLAPQWVGFTATPDRADFQALVPQHYESAPRAQIYEIRQGIEDGWLAKPRFRRVVLPGLKLDQVKSSNGDFANLALASEMMKPEIALDTARVMLRETEDRPTVTFGVTIEHARRLARSCKLIEPECDVRIAHGLLPHAKRREVLEAFQAGEFRLLITVMLLAYGWDCPRASCIVMARPTCSRALYCQSIGRGLRPLPDKPDCLILDIVGNTSRHTLITPEAALEPQYEEPRPAKGFLTVIASSQADEEMEEGLKAGDEEEIDWPKNPVKPQIFEIDSQLQLVGLEVKEKVDGDPPATIKQIKRLDSLGIDDAHLLTLDQASDLIDRLLERDREGWPTIRQAKALWRNGLNPRLRHRKEADKIMELLSANRWRVTKGLKLRLQAEHPNAFVKSEKATVLND